MIKNLLIKNHINNRINISDIHLAITIDVTFMAGLS